MQLRIHWNSPDAYSLDRTKRFLETLGRNAGPRMAATVDSCDDRCLQHAMKEEDIPLEEYGFAKRTLLADPPIWSNLGACGSWRRRSPTPPYSRGSTPNTRSWKEGSVGWFPPTSNGNDRPPPRLCSATLWRSSSAEPAAAANRSPSPAAVSTRHSRPRTPRTALCTPLWMSWEFAPRTRILETRPPLLSLPLSSLHSATWLSLCVSLCACSFLGQNSLLSPPFQASWQSYEHHIRSLFALTSLSRSSLLSLRYLCFWNVNSTITTADCKYFPNHNLRTLMLCFSLSLYFLPSSLLSIRSSCFRNINSTIAIADFRSFLFWVSRCHSTVGILHRWTWNCRNHARLKLLFTPSLRISRAVAPRTWQRREKNRFLSSIVTFKLS